MARNVQFPVDQLYNAFARVSNPENFWGPVLAVVSRNELDVTTAGIIHFLGCDVRSHRGPDGEFILESSFRKSSK